MIRFHYSFRLAATLVLGGVLGLTLSACAEGNVLKGLPGMGTETKTEAAPVPKAAPKTVTASRTPAVRTPSTSVRTTQRPPQLPSLEELLGRMPKPGETFKQPPPLPPSGAVRVGLLLPLTGINSRIGNAMLNAASLALFDFADSDFEILVRDTRGTPEGSDEAARLAIGDGAEVLIGPLLSNSVSAVALSARAAGVPVIAFSSDRRVAGDGVFTMGFFPEDEVRRVVEYAVQKGINRFALLAPDDPYGNAVSSALDAATYRLGASVTAREFYDPLSRDFSKNVRNLADYDRRRAALVDQREYLKQSGDEFSKRALARLKNLQTLGDPPFDALLVADGGKRLISVAALLPFYDVDPGRVKILGTGQWEVAGIGAEPALMGGWFAAPDPKSREAFIEKYRKTYSTRPHRLTTLAYDAMALAVVLARQPENRYAIERIAQSGGFTGRDGVFRFLADGQVERGLAVLEVGQKQARVIDPAPRSFR
ncbi:MAG: penicillin-binding protein activator [Rhodospirillaceae bacterium]|nr:penicillin-binding protein activator [Rhodospirillaceae bacterium]